MAPAKIQDSRAKCPAKKNHRPSTDGCKQSCMICKNSLRYKELLDFLQHKSGGINCIDFNFGFFFDNPFAGSQRVEKNRLGLNHLNGTKTGCKKLLNVRCVQIK